MSAVSGRAGRNFTAARARPSAVRCDAADYANPIEPSGPGGLKIAEAITRVTGVRPDAGSSRVFR